MKDVIEQSTSHLHRVLVQAAQIAVAQGKDMIEPPHLFYGIANEAELFIAHIVAERQSMLPRQELPKKRIDFSLKSKRVLEEAAVLADSFHHSLVDIPHLFMSLLSSKDAHMQILFKDHHIDPKQVYAHMKTILQNTTTVGDLLEYFLPEHAPREQLGGHEEGCDHRHEEESSAVKPPVKTKRITALEYFSTHLTDPSIATRLDPVVGRDREMERLLRILARRTKNNPILLGAPGVGKTAIVEGLAKRIVEGNVPDIFKSRKIYALNLASVVAGSAFRGELEMRLKQIVDDVKQDPSVIIFIDEIHTLVGAGSSSGTLDAANILKPALARGDLRCIGATTPQEYKKYIEDDLALERRFQPIVIEQPSPDEAMRIIEGLAPYYEQHHLVKITPEAIRIAVQLTDRYIPEKFLPDKAIDAIDESAAKLKIDSPRYGIIVGLRQLRGQVDELERQKSAFFKNNELARANYTHLQEMDLRERITLLERQLGQSDQSMVGEITTELIADIIAQATGIPVATLLQEERDRLLNLEQLLSQTIIGQENAKRIVSTSIRRAKAGLQKRGRPSASFLFLGPSGVGKTELAKTVSSLMFGPHGLVKLDMSEFSESFTISRLIGAPSGYIGYKEGGRLTEAVRLRPHSLLLFDEIEKAHPRVANILLQILEDGVLTDGSGKRVDFSNTVIILTSNIGSRLFSENKTLGFGSVSAAVHAPINESDIFKELKECMSPELISRIDHTIIFEALTRQNLHMIVEQELRRASEQAQTCNTKLTWTPRTVRFIVEQAMARGPGARHIRTIIEQAIEGSVAETLLSSISRESRLIRCDVKNRAIIARLL